MEDSSEEEEPFIKGGRRRNRRRIEFYSRNKLPKKDINSIISYYIFGREDEYSDSKDDFLRKIKEELKRSGTSSFSEKSFRSIVEKGDMGIILFLIVDNPKVFNEKEYISILFYLLLLRNINENLTLN